MEAVGRRVGVRSVFLEVRPSNREALGLYRSRGFQVVGRRPEYYDDGEDALLMTLELI
jgi:ribosomal-protein-alanine N-acetyltransferase